MTIAAAPSETGRAHRSAALLRAVLTHGPVARTELAALTGLSPAGVSRGVGALSGLGLLAETPRPGLRSGRGRSPAPVEVVAGRHVVFGVHLAHEFATIAALDLRGRVLAQDRLPHPGRNPHAVLTGIAQHFPGFRQRHQRGRIAVGIGAASGGWVDPSRGVIVEHASLGWHDVPVGAVLTELTGLPVRVDSHARALAAAEGLYGTGRAGRSLVHLFVGNVVDAAIVSGTTPVRGPGSTAGTVAHLPFGDPATTCGCGRSGCLEAEVAEWAVLRRAGKASIAEVVDAAARGEPEPHRLLRHRAETLGRAAAVLLDVINPEVLVITEPGIARVPDLLAALREVVAEHSHTCPDPHRTVVAGSFPRDDVLAVAAGAVQLDAVFSNPTALADRLAPT